ncbi:MAG: hypothetical protein JNK14_07375 [Chitinophagaceae bacterium]|nr:hypothetical protein [Chitinophagaceae bacterium]
MDITQFKQSLSGSKAPEKLSVYMKAMWYDGKGEWEAAHNIIQEKNDDTAAWIHAYLHRKEGDIGNADYWYRRAGRKRPSATLDKEWEDISVELLNTDN